MATRTLRSSKTNRAIDVLLIFVITAAVVTVGLKLAGVVTWPWLWVLAPAWVAILAILVCLLAAGLVLMFVALALASSDWLRR